MWFKILEFIWKTSEKTGESPGEPSEASDEVSNANRPPLRREKPGRTSETAEYLEGRNQHEEQQDTVKPNRVAHAIREYGEIIVFGSAVLAILILGERNMFSSQVRYQQEPIVSLSAALALTGSDVYRVTSVNGLLLQAQY